MMPCRKSALMLRRAAQMDCYIEASREYYRIRLIASAALIACNVVNDKLICAKGFGAAVSRSANQSIRAQCFRSAQPPMRSSPPQSPPWSITASSTGTTAWYLDIPAQITCRAATSFSLDEWLSIWRCRIAPGNHRGDTLVANLVVHLYRLTNATGLHGDPSHRHVRTRHQHVHDDRLAIAHRERNHDVLTCYRLASRYWTRSSETNRLRRCYRLASYIIGRHLDQSDVIATDRLAHLHHSSGNQYLFQTFDRDFNIKHPVRLWTLDFRRTICAAAQE